jgi:hypothetical protein
MMISVGHDQHSEVQLYHHWMMNIDIVATSLFVVALAGLMEGAVLDSSKMLY